MILKMFLQMKTFRMALTIFLILTLLCVSVLFSHTETQAQTKPKKVHYLSIVPFHAPEKLIALYQPMIDYLNANSKYHWQLKLFAKHSDVQEALCSGNISIAMLGPLMTSLAYENCSAKPILIALGIDKSPTFKIVLITADKSIQTTKDLEGKTVALFKPYTVAHAATKLMLTKDKVNLSSINFVIYSKMEDIVLEVMTGKVAAGGIRESLYKNVESNLNLRIIRQSENLPGFAFFAKPSLDKKVIADFQNAMTKLNVNKNPRTLAITSKWDLEVANGFVLPDKKHVEKTIDLYQSLKDYIQ